MRGLAEVGAPGASSDRHVPDKWPVRQGLADMGGGLSHRRGDRAEAVNGPDQKAGPRDLVAGPPRAMMSPGNPRATSLSAAAAWSTWAGLSSPKKRRVTCHWSGLDHRSRLLSGRRRRASAQRPRRWATPLRSSARGKPRPVPPAGGAGAHFADQVGVAVMAGVLFGPAGPGRERRGLNAASGAGWRGPAQPRRHG